jgi:hypothetical protein
MMINEDATLASTTTQQQKMSQHLLQRSIRAFKTKPFKLTGKKGVHNSKK